MDTDPLTHFAFLFIAKVRRLVRGPRCAGAGVHERIAELLAAGRRLLDSHALPVSPAVAVYARHARYVDADWLLNMRLPDKTELNVRPSETQLCNSQSIMWHCLYGVGRYTYKTVQSYYTRL